ncbi:hypothetical protein [Sphingopyxis macrogoltabida]|uniref:Uncharacterized protein n=1 Tax=Sphingopyxis macrogoltabida TaxID=33050 RepID=A0AAC9ATY1_SPHMC|nr:hypothetical protein [Sphingopyxis macrogoltabida]ALJ11393.1 hypothetical protein LH19_00820 [Sphingopyxis macrogoltabida]AMU87587.1 hypothetical protein ATM17_00815 [Sphingopyxis macrogoltabida]
MNLAPSDLPRIAGAASLSNPGFDIILAVSSARQAMLPTVRLLQTRSNRESHAARVGALRHYLGGAAGGGQGNASRPARFFDLSRDVNALPETMNSLFTRGFQPMLNPSELDRSASVNPIPPTLKRWNEHD